MFLTDDHVTLQSGRTLPTARDCKNTLVGDTSRKLRGHLQDCMYVYTYTFLQDCKNTESVHTVLIILQDGIDNCSDNIMITIDFCRDDHDNSLW